MLNDWQCPVCEETEIPCACDRQTIADNEAVFMVGAPRPGSLPTGDDFKPTHADMVSSAWYLLRVSVDELLIALWNYARSRFGNLD